MSHPEARRTVLLVGGDEPLTRRLAESLAGRFRVETVTGSPEIPAAAPEAVVYLASARGAGALPDLDDAGRVFEVVAGSEVGQLVVVGSAAVNQASHHHAGLVGEGRRPTGRGGSPIAKAWWALERLAKRELDGRLRIVTLRPTWVPVAGGRDPVSRMFCGRLAATAPGFDPAVQLLSVEDLAQAVALAVAGEAEGVFYVAPDGAMSLRKALGLAGRRQLPTPGWVQALGGRSRSELAYRRHPWTVSNRKIKESLGFEPRATTAEVARALGNGRGARRRGEAEEFDAFGLDRDYIAAYGRTLFRFLHDLYWRVELAGLDNVPREGRGVLVGVHRGFMPWDGVMAVHALVRELGRYPRFLIHPTLVKFPFLANYMTKLGGIHACQENADWVLERDGLLGVFPEGIRGAFSYYREAYRLKKFGRDEYVRMALRSRAPIIPFVTVGSAEIFPILAKVNWRWWKRYSEWPCFPITPTLGLVPLPSKWHTRFLEPMHLAERYPAETADDPRTVRAISHEVRTRIETALQQMRANRKSVFFGSVFEERPA